MGQTQNRPIGWYFRQIKCIGRNCREGDTIERGTGLCAVLIAPHSGELATKKPSALFRACLGKIPRRGRDER